MFLLYEKYILHKQKYKKTFMCKHYWLQMGHTFRQQWLSFSSINISTFPALNFYPSSYFFLIAMLVVEDIKKKKNRMQGILSIPVKLLTGFIGWKSLYSLFPALLRVPG